MDTSMLGKIVVEMALKEIAKWAATKLKLNY
jgi:hypothetical protein